VIDLASLKILFLSFQTNHYAANNSELMTTRFTSNPTPVLGGVSTATKLSISISRCIASWHTPVNRRSCDICNKCAEQIRKHHECASIVADVHRATQYYGVNGTVRRARSAIFREKTKEKKKRKNKTDDVGAKDHRLSNIVETFQAFFANKTGRGNS